MGSSVAAHRNKLNEEITGHTTVMAVMWTHSVAVSNGVVQSAGSVAGFTAEQVEEVRMVVRMFPIFLTTIFYWTIYSQVQALGPPRLPLPVASLIACCSPCGAHVSHPAHYMLDSLFLEHVCRLIKLLHRIRVCHRPQQRWACMQLLPGTAIEVRLWYYECA